MAKKEKQVEVISRGKKIFRLCLSLFQILVIITTVLISIFTILNVKKTAVEELSYVMGRSYLPVLTDSMVGDNPDSFAAGDLVVVKRPEDPNALKIGDIITYTTNVNGIRIVNSHRIVDVGEPNGWGDVPYITQGDNNPVIDEFMVYSTDILGVYVNHVKGVGKTILWIQDPSNFFIVIVIPLIVLVVINGFQFIKMVIDLKMKNVKEQALAAAALTPQISEEELKRKFYEEFLKEQAKKEQANNTTLDNDTSQTTDEEKQ